MLKPQDCIILLKIMAHPGEQMPQRRLASELKISLSEVNSGIKRLALSGLVSYVDDQKLKANKSLAREFLIHGLKYVFPVMLGEITVGIPTAVGAPIFADEISLGSEFVPVWPDAKGGSRGVALEPLYPTLPQAIRENPDQNFYELLVIIDAIRAGRARERNLAIKMLDERL